MNPQQKVLLLGGTSESAPLAQKLVEAGYRVLVSTATDAKLHIDVNNAIERRHGRLSFAQMTDLLMEQGMFAVIDATHPYATEVQQTARRAAEQIDIDYLRYQRPQSDYTSLGANWVQVKDHTEAATVAIKSGKPILLTTGSRNLNCYIEVARRTHVPIYARILNHPESITACDVAGLSESERIYGRGPFSIQQNIELIRQYEIGVIVTKESGKAGGIEEKWLAAKQENCLFIVVQRPEASEHCFSNYDELISALQAKANKVQDRGIQ